ncbi:MAG: kelch repeat-containing protein [Planctomycetota bacterium]
MPSLRTEVAMDSDGSGALLFGGQYGPSSIAYNELWRYDGTTWTLLQPVGAPPPARSRFAAAYDPVRQRLVVFGGDAQYAGGGSLGDTWEWDPQTSTWTQMTPAATPTPRIHARLVFDPANANLLLFGGRGAGGSETWSWDGANWTLRTPTNVPPAREQTHLATNWGNGTVLMFGGSSAAASGVLGDTWIWNGVDWNALAPATTPGTGGLRNGKATYDFLRDRVVVHGGITSGGGFSASAWEFDGIDWTQRLPATLPVGRTGAGFCYVAALERSVLFGGYNGAVQGDQWDYQTNAVATATTFGTGCPASLGVPTITAAARPWLGDTVAITTGNIPGTALPFVVAGLSTTAWVGGALPFSLAPYGFPACSLLVSNESQTFALGPLSLTVPNATGFLGVRLNYQAAALEPAGSGFTLGMSAGLTLTLGAR